MNVLPAGRRVAVYVTDITDPESFSVQLAEGEAQLTQMMRQIGEFCDGGHARVPDRLQLGSFMLGRFTDDKEWYRAKITGKARNLTCRLVIIDQFIKISLFFCNLE